MAHLCTGVAVKIQLKMEWEGVWLRVHFGLGGVGGEVLDLDAGLAVDREECPLPAIPEEHRVLKHLPILSDNKSSSGKLDGVRFWKILASKKNSRSE